MKISEFKLRVIQALNGLVDDYFGSDTFSDKIINGTLKILIKQNTYQLDEILSIFADENGCIDEKLVIEEYSKVLGDNGFIFDIRNFVKKDAIKNMLPNKALVIKTSDLRKMLAPLYE